MSKYIIRDDDLIEIMDLLIKIALDEDSKYKHKADYIAEKLSEVRGTDYMGEVEIRKRSKESK